MDQAKQTTAFDAAAAPAMTPDSIASAEAGMRNAIGIPLDKLRQSPGRPKGARNLHAKHPSSIAKAFKRAGLDWQADFALAIKTAGEYGTTPETKRAAAEHRKWAKERIALWLRLLPYLITQRNHSTVVKRWKGKASKAAMVALQALEEKNA